MWIVYCLHYGQHPRVELFCFTQDFTTAINALDDYAIANYRLRYPKYPQNDNPLDDDAKDQLPKGVKHYLQLDEESINPLGDAERILLIEKSSQTCVAHYQVENVGKYVDDYTRERTQAVAQLERDAAINFDQEILEQETSSSEDEEESDSEDDGDDSA